MGVLGGIFLGTAIVVLANAIDHANGTYFLAILAIVSGIFLSFVLTHLYAYTQGFTSLQAWIRSVWRRWSKGSRSSTTARRHS